MKRATEKVKAIHDRSSASCSSGRISTAVFCLSVGTNEIQKRSEELVNNYKDMLDNLRSRGGTAVVHSILPGVGVSHEWQSRALGIKSRLEKITRDSGMTFIDSWARFYGKKYLYASDGVHLSRAGTTCKAL